LRTLARAEGLVVRSDLVGPHLSDEAWWHAHRSGILISVHRGVSRLVDAPPTARQLISAAVLAAAPPRGPGRAMAAGRAAAFLLGSDVAYDDPIHVAVRGRPRPAPLNGVAIHRPVDHLDLVAVDINGIPATRCVRSLLDVAAWDPWLTSEVMDGMIVQRRLTIADVAAAVTRHSRKGRPGLTVLRAAVDAWALRQRPPDSVLEARFARLARQCGLPPFEFQRPVGRHRPDFCRRREMIIVECDGYAHHGRRPEQTERDKARDAELAAQGWVVLRFTWRQIADRPGWVAGRILATLRVRTAQLGPAT